MIVKKHVSQDGQMILSICDSELIGKTFEEGDKWLDLTSKFYRGTEMSESEILSILPNAHSVNMVGTKTIDFAIKHKLILKSHVLYVQKVPYAICVFDERAK
ncbi:MAG: DUF424 family protein [Candidatus Woesearchaeota archaeon]